MVLVDTACTRANAERPACPPARCPPFSAHPEQLGVTPNTMRPPYGDIDDRVRAISLAMGLTPIIWTIANGTSFDTGDWQVAGGVVSADAVVSRFEGFLNNADQLDTGFIVLEHDLYQQVSGRLSLQMLYPDGSEGGAGAWRTRKADCAHPCPRLHLPVHKLGRRLHPPIRPQQEEPHPRTHLPVPWPEPVGRLHRDGFQQDWPCRQLDSVSRCGALQGLVLVLRKLSFADRLKMQSYPALPLVNSQ